MGLMWWKLTGPHRISASTPSNTFGMTWNAPREPASEFHLTNVFLDKWAKIPTDTFQNPLESLPRKGKAVINVTG